MEAQGRERAIPPRPLDAVRRDLATDTKLGALVPSREAARTRCLEFSEAHGRLARTTEFPPWEETFARRELNKYRELANGSHEDPDLALTKGPQLVRNDQDTELQVPAELLAELLVRWRNGLRQF